MRERYYLQVRTMQLEYNIIKKLRGLSLLEYLLIIRLVNYNETTSLIYKDDIQEIVPSFRVQPQAKVLVMRY